MRRQTATRHEPKSSNSDIKKRQIHQFNMWIPLVIFFTSCYSGVFCASCVRGQLDLLFVIDSSATVGMADFQLERNFAANLAENFHIGEFQFGALTFSDSTTSLFYLNNFTEYQPIERAIVNAQYFAGSTRTYQALESARNFLILANGARPNVPKVVVVLTNGRSDDATRTQQQATFLRNSGVYVITVGFSNPNNAELAGMASNTAATFSYRNFTSVLRALQDYSNVACDQQVCVKGQLDVLFVLDSSTTVASADFTRSQSFAANLAENFQIGPNGVQFGALTYSDSYHNLFDFNNFTEYSDIQRALLRASYLSGSTNTHLALDNSRNIFFGNHGARPGAKKVAVILTNGLSSDPVSARQQAAWLKNAGVYVIVVGVASVGSAQLQDLASSPQLVFLLSNFSGVLRAVQDYQNNACEQASPAPCPRNEVDFLFVLDSSSTVSLVDFNYGLRFAANLAEHFQVGSDDFLFAAMIYSDSPRHVFNFSSHQDFASLEKALVSASYLSGSTNTHLALADSRTFLGDQHGGRPRAYKVVVVLTNGRSSDHTLTKLQATALKVSGVYLVAVGYSNPDRQELLSLASEPAAVADFRDFKGALKILQDFTRQVCFQ